MKNRVKQIRVVAMPNAFTYEKDESTFGERTRLSEIMTQSLKRKDMIERANVWIYDKDMKYPPIHVKPEDYASTIVKGNTLVSLRVCPTGGGGDGGGKNVLKIIATIALVVVAAYFGPALGGALLPAGTSAATAAAVGTGLIMTVGSFAINALIPPPQLQLDSRGGGAAKESPTLSITGAGNRMNPYGVVPRVFGQYKVYPTMAAQPYTEISGNKQYLRLLFDFGYGELSLSDLKIGNTAIANFEEVETEIQYGTGAETNFKLYSMTVDEENQNLLISNSGGAQVLTTSVESNEAIIDGYFAGLVSISTDGSNQVKEVDIKYEYSLAGVGSWTTSSTTTYSNKTRQAYYVSHRIQLPSAAEYDIRITRTTADSDSDLILDVFTVSNLKSVKDAPPINVTGRCMVAMRIKASEQLNGVVDQFNAIATAKFPTWNGSAWTAAVETRNPAWAYAAVLRGAANVNPVADSLIDGDGLKTWADACDALAQDGVAKWRFDAVVDFQTTVFELLRDIATAGRASFTMVDGLYSVLQDTAKSTVIQHFSPRNSWGFSATKVFAETIHGIKCRWINPDRDYAQDEVIAYDDTYSATNATKFVSMQLWGTTSENQAWREGRYAMAVARLRPEVYSLNCDIENLICTRGDLVRVTHDVTGWGQKAARITAITLNGSSECTHVTLDEEVTMATGLTYNLRLRAADGASTLQSIVLNVATVTQLEFTTAIAAGSVPVVGDLVMFGETDTETVELIVKSITPGKDFTAMLELLDEAPGIHTSDTEAIPAFDPKISTTPERVRAAPEIPVIIDLFSDENALFVNSDGTTVPQIIIDIQPPPAGTSVPRSAIEVRYRLEGVAEYSRFVVDGNPTRLIINPVEEQQIYDLGLRAHSYFGETSEWKTQLGYEVEGRVAPPATPANFTINVIDTTSHLYWTANTESDLRDYTLRFSPKTTGASYEHSIDLLTKIPKAVNSAIVPSRTGTYFLKAFDTLNKASATAAEVTTIFESVKNLNVVETQTESPTFSGTKTDVLVNSESKLILDNTVLWDSLTGNIDDWAGLLDAGGGSTGSVNTTGTYEFATYVDLGSKYTSRITATVDQTAIDYADSFDSLLGNLDQLQGNWDDLNSITAPDVNVTLQVAVTDDDPSGSPTWGSWLDFFVGDYTARALKFRAVLTSSNVYQTPRVETLSVVVDMPDRIESADDISSTAGTKSITLSPTYKSIKGIAISAQDLVQGDYYRITSKTTSGFDITFYDSGDAAVDRTFDWTVTGYGHLAS
jgi:DNA-binding protein YbaB